MYAIRSMATASALAACLLSQLVQAQDRPPMGPGQGPGGPGMGHGMMMHMGPPAILEATDKYVYVLRGDTLFQYSADGLKLLARAELPRPEPRDHPDGKSAPRKQ